MSTRIDSKPQGPAPEASVDSQIQLLRSRVEAEIKKPAVVMVTSAHAGDGKSLTASSLATSFAKSGHRAALVSENRGAGHDLDSALERRAHGRVTTVELPPESDDAVSLESLKNFVDTMRTGHDYTIVDAGAFLDSNSAMALPGVVDGILLTVRVGRASSDKDEMMVRMIEHLGSNVIGVVATDPAAIAAFERSAQQASGESTRPRPAERKPARVLVTTVLAGAIFAALASSPASTSSTLAGIPVGQVGAQVSQATGHVRDVVSRFTGVPLLARTKD